MSFLGQQVLLKSPINPDTGYGRDGLCLTQNLSAMGADLHLEPNHVGIPLPQDVANFFTKSRPQRPYFDLAIHHAYPGELGFPESIRDYASKVIGWTMYEFTSFGNTTEMTNKLEERLAPLDLLLAYDEVSKQSLLPYFPNDRIHILQGGYDADFWKPKDGEPLRDWDDTFKFCMNGTMNLRKNPWATILGFKWLKDEYGKDFDAELHLKTTTNSLSPQVQEWCPDLYLHSETWEPDKLRNFYANMHCLLAPSWGEGKNLPALEAQTMGCVAAVSKFGGHMQWADPEWCYLLDGPIEFHDDEQQMGSMRVTPETVAESMWHIYNNREEARLKGEMAARYIPMQCDWQVVLEKLQFKLANLTRVN